MEPLVDLVREEVAARSPAGEGALGGCACVVHCGSTSLPLMDALLGVDVVWIDEDPGSCRRLDELAGARPGALGAPRVRLGPPELVMGPDEAFDLIVDPGVPPDSARTAVTSVAHTLGLATHHLRPHGLLILRADDPRQSATVRGLVADSELRIVRERRGPGGSALLLARPGARVHDDPSAPVGTEPAQSSSPGTGTAKPFSSIETEQ